MVARISPAVLLSILLVAACSSEGDSIDATEVDSVAQEAITWTTGYPPPPKSRFCAEPRGLKTTTPAAPFRYCPLWCEDRPSGAIDWTERGKFAAFIAQTTVATRSTWIRKGAGPGGKPLAMTTITCRTILPATIQMTCKHNFGRSLAIGANCGDGYMSTSVFNEGASRFVAECKTGGGTAQTALNDELCPIVDQNQVVKTPVMDAPLPLHVPESEAPNDAAARSLCEREVMKALPALEKKLPACTVLPPRAATQKQDEGWGFVCCPTVTEDPIVVEVVGGGRVEGTTSGQPSSFMNREKTAYATSCVSTCSLQEADHKLVARPFDGWKFVRWEGTGCTGAGETCSIAQGKGDSRTVRAVFERGAELGARVEVRGEGVVRATLKVFTMADGTLNNACVGPAVCPFAPGAKPILLQAYANVGSTFEGWTHPNLCKEKTNLNCYGVSAEGIGKSALVATFLKGPTLTVEKPLDTTIEGEVVEGARRASFYCGLSKTTCTQVFPQATKLKLSWTRGTSNLKLANWRVPGCSPNAACTVTLPPPGQSLTLKTLWDSAGSVSDRVSVSDRISDLGR